MSQMPDKIWLHKDTKYSTGDKVVGYQYKFLAEIEGIENFVEYTCTDTLIESVCAFLKDRIEHDSIDYPMATMHLIKDLKQYIYGNNKS